MKLEPKSPLSSEGHDMSIDLSSLKDLPAADKLRIVTELWNDIAASNEPIVVPEEIVREASRRSAELKADPSIAIDERELWRRIDGSASFGFILRSQTIWSRPQRTTTRYQRVLAVDFALPYAIDSRPLPNDQRPSRAFINSNELPRYTAFPTSSCSRNRNTSYTFSAYFTPRLTSLAGSPVRADVGRRTPRESPAELRSTTESTTLQSDCSNSLRVCTYANASSASGAEGYRFKSSRLRGGPSDDRIAGRSPRNWRPDRATSDRRSVYTGVRKSG